MQEAVLAHMRMLLAGQEALSHTSALGCRGQEPQRASSRIHTKALETREPCPSFMRAYKADSAYTTPSPQNLHRPLDPKSRPFAEAFWGASDRRGGNQGLQASFSGVLTYDHICYLVSEIILG